MSIAYRPPTEFPSQVLDFSFRASRDPFLNARQIVDPFGVFLQHRMFVQRARNFLGNYSQDSGDEKVGVRHARRSEEFPATVAGQMVLQDCQVIHQTGADVFITQLRLFLRVRLEPPLQIGRPDIYSENK